MVLETKIVFHYSISFWGWANLFHAPRTKYAVYVQIIMRRLITIIILIAILSSIVLAEDCTDTDGGLNYFERGTVEGWNIDHTERMVNSDACNNGNLVEMYCNENDVIAYEFDVECEFGCLNGACVSEQAELPDFVMYGFQYFRLPENRY